MERVDAVGGAGRRVDKRGPRAVPERGRSSRRARALQGGGARAQSVRRCRELPLRLYGVPLLPVNEKIIAKKIAELVPVPRYRSDLEDLYGGTAKYLGLPTGMDLFGNKLLVTTYRNAYLYDYSALVEPPEEVNLPYVGQREAITFGFESSEVAYVSREREKGTQVADIFEIRLSDRPN